MLFFLAACKNNGEVKELELNVEETIDNLIALADTDGDKKITKDDKGVKSYKYELYEIDGTYKLSVLLQELALAKNEGKKVARIPISRIEESPSARISRMIKEYYWDDLTRTVDEKGLKTILEDAKASDTVKKRIYVPYTDTIAQQYFKNLESKYNNFLVEVLPEHITPQYVKSINKVPGILSLKLEDGEGVPFVVPGGRFNEMYGWDSYFEGVGLIIDGRTDLAKAMVDNFCYQIEHYGKILNANRSYYLTRTQPPFLSSFIREVFEAQGVKDTAWLASSLETAIKEYEKVWMEKDKRLTSTGLNRYLASGIGIPPETEEGHFNEILTEFAEKYNASLPNFEKNKLTVQEYIEKYESGEIEDKALDMYFVHDRSLRESGHDTSWRLDNVCAYLNTVDINSLIYKYETDFEYLINKYFKGNFKTSKGKVYTSGQWNKKAGERKELMNKFLWNENAGSYFDYNFMKAVGTNFQSATNFFPLWAKIPTKEQAERMVQNLMKDLKAKGGILASSKESVEKAATNDIQRQWDYPYGWAPHQMLMWVGLKNYGYEKEARELAYRWLWMITRNAVDYNGTIPEKYDVVNCTHKVYAEYGNVGTEFDYITTSGFGWMNASYQLGLKILSEDLVNELNLLTDPETLFSKE
ncbi:alpha,alpha-trehalase [Abyssalbus ytuae]|uniref:Alpha,alpha-trehalase n=1 Tax=Abyssalbus ytuae TaxID=2926907 RepID=A0A9E7CUU7_9FLAO|nr:alpha,alpha-trehalase [Abyssalbus ytuae]UOB18987.1 alpha,alpha-trehalase [Abyssalbus ytuae]